MGNGLTFKTSNIQQRLGSILLLLTSVPVYGAPNQEDVDYWTIEGMRSQQFSIGIFIFMLIGVAVFLGIVYQMTTVKKASEKLKTGEKVMIMCIILGVVAAVTFGATQLLQGRLF